MSPAAAGSGVPSRSELEGWDTSYLDDADIRWRAGAEASESGFEQHLRNVTAPGGTTWSGEAADAALDRAFLDLTVVRNQSDMQRQAASLALEGSADIQWARRQVLDAIAEAEDDGFRVGEDFSVTDTRKVELGTAAARATAATEHAEFIRWRAEQLVATDALVGQQLQAKAAELEGIRFEGEVSDGTIHLVDFKQSPPTEPGPQPKPQHPDYPERTVDGRYKTANSGRDGKWEEKIALDKYEEKTQVPIIRDQVKATHPNAVNRDGSLQRRYYDGLQPTGAPGEYIGIEGKGDGVKVRPPQSTFDALVDPDSPATAILNGEEIKIIGTVVVQPNLVPQPDPTVRIPEVPSARPPDLPVQGGIPGPVVGAEGGGATGGRAPVLPDWGTPVSPGDLAEADFPLGPLGKVLEQYLPPDPNTMA